MHKLSKQGELICQKINVPMQGPFEQVNETKNTNKDLDMDAAQLKTLKLVKWLYAKKALSFFFFYFC